MPKKNSKKEIPERPRKIKQYVLWSITYYPAKTLLILLAMVIIVIAGVKLLSLSCAWDQEKGFKNIEVKGTQIEKLIKK